MTPRRFGKLPRLTRAYIGVVIVVGSATIAHSFVQLYLQNVPWPWTILALLTLVSGSATVNLPALPAVVSVSETFVFTSVLLFGPAAGTLTVALDALIISFWSYKKIHSPYKVLFNICAVALTLWVSSHIYYELAPYGPLYYVRNHPIRTSALLWPLLAFTVAYYAINTGLITFAIALERGVSPLHIWREHFLWLALNYFGGASVAALLVSYIRDLDYTFLIVIAPLLVVLYFTFSTSMGRVRDSNEHLQELNSLYMATIETLAMAIDAKDQITHGHIRRVQLYAVGLAQTMGITEEAQIRAIEAAALLHDMGKLAVPEYILNKPGPLTPAEFEKMKLHASVGADILSSIAFPYPVVPIVRHHHECWDGTGYPDRLAGTDIPIGARILSVVDCFDALTSDRPYRPRLPDREAIKILHERRATMYDPLVVDTFVRVYATLAASVDAQPVSASSLRAIAEASTVPAEIQESRTSRFEEIAASSDEMLTLFELARSLSTTMGTQDATDLIAKHLRRLVPSSACVFYMYDEETDELVASHASGENVSFIKGLRVPRGQRLCGWVAANRLTIRNSDPVLDLGESARAMSPRPRSCISTPLIAGDTLVGVLSLYSSNKDAYSEEHERILEVISRQVSGTVRGAHASERARKTSLKDHTTGLPNLNHLIEFITAQLVTDTRHPFCLIVVKFGGREIVPTAEEMEAAVATVKRTLRPADLLFRSGLDELAGLLLNTERGPADAIAARLIGNLTQLRGSGGIATFQIGVACGPADADEGQQLLGFARERAAAANGPAPPRAIH